MKSQKKKKKKKERKRRPLGGLQDLSGYRKLFNISLEVSDKI